MNKNYILSIAVASAMVIPTSVFATNGMMPMGFGAKAKGMAGVSIALPQEATAAANNPAGMVHLGNRIDLGAELFRADRTGEISGNPGPINFRADANNDAVALIPEGGFNKMINNNTSFGISVVGVGGMNTNYDKIMMFNKAAYPTETGIDLMQLKIIPTIAYKFNDKHSVGFGVEIGYQQFEAYGLDGFTGTGPGAFSVSPANMTNHGYDSALGLGFTVGWQGQMTDQLTLGAAYHSKNNMQEFDDYKGLFAEQGDLDMPAWFGLGLSYQVSPKLVVGLDFTRTLYSGVDSISNKIASGNNGMDMFTPGTMMGEDNGSGFAWKDINVFKLGMAYEINPSLVVRAGWSHGQNPISEDQTFLNLLAPATIKDHINIGATWTMANNGELTMYAYHALKNKVDGSGSIPAAFGGGEANIEMSQLAIGVAYGWNF